MMTVERVRDAANILPWFTSDIERWFMRLRSNDALRIEDANDHDDLSRETSNWVETLSAAHTLTSWLADKFVSEELNFEEPIDPNGSVSDAIESEENRLKDVLERFRLVTRRFASKSQQSDSTKRTLNQISEFEGLMRSHIGILQELRWAIMVHDGIREPTTGRRFTSGKDLLEASSNKKVL